MLPTAKYSAYIGAVTALHLLACTPKAETTSMRRGDAAAPASQPQIDPNATSLHDPVDLVAQAVSTTEIDMTWAADGAASAGYRIASAAGDIPPADCSAGDATADTRASLTGLTAATTYSVRICAVDASTPANVTAGVTTSIATLQILTLAPASGANTVPTGNSVTLAAAGGTAPYTFALASGGGSIDANSGVFTADRYPGLVTVTVTDGQGVQSDSRLYVYTKHSVAIGAYHTCVITPQSQVKCWGYNGVGQLGVGDALDRGGTAASMGPALPAVNLGTGRKALSLSLGKYYSCALLDDLTVKCWGDNAYGSLGQGDTVERGSGPGQLGDNLPAVDLGGHKVLQLSSGGYQTCAVLDDQSLKCWGWNGNFQLGTGDAVNYGAANGTMGAGLPTVNLGTGRRALEVSGGKYHTCALLDDFSVKCWGENGAGELGQGDTLARGGTPASMGDGLPVVALGTGRTVRTLSAGGYHTCAILDNGAAKCWGDNLHGALGLGTTVNMGSAPNQMGDQLPAVDLGTGRSALRLGTAGHNGADESCALLDDQTFKCWGYNANGELGQGNTTEVGSSANQMGSHLAPIDVGTGKKITEFAVGGHTTGAICAFLDTGSLKCWGANSYGQLGLGDTTSRGNTPSSMGDMLPAVSF